MKDFDVKALGGAKIPEGVKFTKELKRNVNGKEASIFIGTDANNKKVRYTVVDGKMEELQEKTTAGKNTYVTKKENDAIIMQMLGTKSVPEGVTVKYITDHNGTVSPVLFMGTEKLDAQGMKLLAQRQRVSDMQNEKELAKNEQPKGMPGHVKLAVDITQKLVADGVIKTEEEIYIRKQMENNAKAAEDLAAVAPENTVTSKKTLARRPKGTFGDKGVSKDVVVTGNNQEKAYKKRDKTYPPMLAMNDPRMSKTDLNGTYYLTPPKPQGNGRLDPPNRFNEYEKVKVGNKEIFIRKRLLPGQREAIIKAEEAKQAEAKAKAEANAKAKAKRQEIINKGRFAGNLNGFTKDSDLDIIVKDIKSLNSGNVRTYLEGYKGKVGNYPSRNFFNKLWHTSHYGKPSDKWQQEKLDLMDKILKDMSATPGAKNAKFETTDYSKGTKTTKILTIESVRKELAEAKAKIQKGIAADEVVRDVERIMSRFGFGDANA